MQLFFDVDGTLIDSAPGIYASFQVACNSLGLHAPQFNIFREKIGPPVQLLAKQFFPELTEQAEKEFRIAFRQDYDNHSFRHYSWYEGVKDTIRTLASSPDVGIHIVTNKPTFPTLEILKDGDLLDCFDLVVGIDYQFYHRSGATFDTKADAIRLAHSNINQKPCQAIYIGDTPSDRQASQANGLRFIAATYGFHRWSHTELASSNHISSFIELLSLLNHLG